MKKEKSVFKLIFQFYSLLMAFPWVASSYPFLSAWRAKISKNAKGAEIIFKDSNHGWLTLSYINKLTWSSAAANSRFLHFYGLIKNGIILATTMSIISIYWACTYVPDTVLSRSQMLFHLILTKVTFPNAHDSKKKSGFELRFNSRNNTVIFKDLTDNWLS